VGGEPIKVDYTRHILRKYLYQARKMSGYVFKVWTRLVFVFISITDFVKTT
jgi:hypothetical protein